MVFSFFSAYGYSETETTENLFQFRSGSFDPSEILPLIPREIQSRSFPFVFLQHLAILDICNQDFVKSSSLSKTGILCGSATGGISELSLQHKKFQAKGINKISPLTVLQTIHNSASSVLAIEHKLKGISSGYNCMETSGVEALCDGLELISSNEYEQLFVGAGEDLRHENQNLTLVGGLFFLSKKNLKNSLNFKMECLLNRGKPWLQPEENLLDVFNSYFENNIFSKKEKWIYFNFQSQQKDLLENYPIELVEFPAYCSYLSLGPLLAIAQGMNLYSEFKVLVISSEGHSVLMDIKKDSY